MFALLVAWEVERVFFRAALVALVFKFVKDAILAWRARAKPSAPPVVQRPLPRVTVQLPMRNELYVADRVIDAVANLDYPRELLEIQVLDDSDDETVGLVDATVARLRADGVDVRAIRREKAEGAKAGALAHGLRTATGDYIAIFDADFVPEADFLTRTMGYFQSDPRVGMVQGRWEFMNRSASVLTQVQAVIIDGLMLVEQPAKMASRVPLHFNGTGGVWRRECIDDVGGWSSATVVEDLDLSFRAARRGWRLVHVPAVAVPTELPETMSAYRTQQSRWTRGNAQVARRMWWSLVRGDLPLLHRFAMLGRTLSRLIFVCLAFLTFTMPLSTFQLVPPLLDYGWKLDAVMAAAVLAAHYVFYGPARRAAGRSLASAVYLIPIVMALYVGMSLSLSIAYLAGLVFKNAEFVRTPKWGGVVHAGRSRYRLTVNRLAVLELVVGVLYFGLSAYALHRRYYPSGLFFFFWAAAHSWVGGSSVIGGVEPISPPRARWQAAGLALRAAAGMRPRAEERGTRILTTELARSRRNGETCAIVLISVPEVPAGATTRPMVDVIDTLASDALRANDTVVAMESGRVLVVLPRADDVAASSIAARLRARIDIGTRRANVSVRLVHLTPAGPTENAASLIARANALLEARFESTRLPAARGTS